MSENTVTTVTCDRCGATAEKGVTREPTVTEKKTRPAAISISLTRGWVRIISEHITSSRLDSWSVDLCAKCNDKLHKWMTP